MVSYGQVIEAAIERESGILGEQKAVEKAKEVDGLEIDEEGHVLDIEGEGQQVLKRLVDRYEEVGGSVTASLIARRIKKIGGDELELPEKLESRL